MLFRSHKTSANPQNSEDQTEASLWNENKSFNNTFEHCYNDYTVGLQNVGNELVVYFHKLFVNFLIILGVLVSITINLFYMLSDNNGNGSSNLFTTVAASAQLWIAPLISPCRYLKPPV